MPDRLKKINDLLRDETGRILLNELRLSDGILVTVTRALVSPTLEHATIYISVLPENKSKDILKKLKFEIFGIQQQLNKILQIRTVPKIRFEIDTVEQHASYIEEILQKVGEK